MSHQAFMESLKDPYKKKHKLRVIRSLKRKIQTLNSRFTRPGDFIQSKIGFKEKVGGIVRVPETYFFTKYPNDIFKGLENEEFVMKPNHLSRGLGIRVLKRIGDDCFEDINGDILTKTELIEEANEIMKVRRGSGRNSGILFEERIRSHKDFHKFMFGDGVADIRMVFYDKKFLFGVARFPTKESKGYGNTGRGAVWGIFLDAGVFVSGDKRFLPTDIDEGILPFYEKMIQASQKVLDLYQFPFQTVDLTVDDKGEAVVIESEKSPQLEVYLTKDGGVWLYKKILMGLKGQ